MKIALLINGLTVIGGAEVLVKELALGLRRKSHDVTVISLACPTYFAQELEDAGVKVWSPGLQKNWFAGFRILLLAWKLLIENYDVIHGHLFQSNVLTRIAGALHLSPRTICSIHNTYEKDTRAAEGSEGRTKREWVYHFTDAWCDCTVQISKVGLERYRSLGIASRQRSLMIYNGIPLRNPVALRRADLETRRAEFGGEDCFLWLAVGRHIEQKNFPLLLEAAAQLRSGGYRFRLWIFGEGPLRPHHEELVREKGLGDRVFIPGVRLDMRDIMPAFDAFVMSSNFEGLPMVLIEAAFAGLPIVTTDTGGCAEIFDPVSGGAAVPPRDISALTGAMENLMRLPSTELRQAGEANRTHVLQSFDMDTVVSQWEGLYQSSRSDV